MMIIAHYGELRKGENCLYGQEENKKSQRRVTLTGSWNNGIPPVGGTGGDTGRA